MGYPERHVGVLLDEEDRRPRGVDLPDDLENRLHELWGEAERRLVQEQEARAGEERAADGEHLLLAARERPGTLIETLLQAREQREHAVAIAPDVLAVRAREGAQVEVFVDGEIGKDAAPLGDLRQAEAQDLVRRPSREVLAVERDRSAGGLHQSTHRAQRRRFAGAVGSDQRDDLARLDGYRNAVKGPDRAVVDGEVLDREERHPYAPASIGSPR